MKKMLLMAFWSVAALLAMSGSAQAQCQGCGDGGRGGLFSGNHGPTWHGAYAHSEYGGPVALAVPHRARKHTNYFWGNPSSNTTHIRSRFHAGGGGECGGYGGGNGGGGYAGGIYPTPAWPSHTDQFGVYYVRVPRRY